MRIIFLEVAKKFCDLTNVVMPIWRSIKFPFSDDVLLLPYICESCLVDESLRDYENSLEDVQISLSEA